MRDDDENEFFEYDDSVDDGTTLIFALAMTVVAMLIGLYAIGAIG